MKRFFAIFMTFAMLFSCAAVQASAKMIWKDKPSAQEETEATQSTLASQTTQPTQAAQESRFASTYDVETGAMRLIDSVSGLDFGIEKKDLGNTECWALVLDQVQTSVSTVSTEFWDGNSSIGFGAELYGFMGAKFSFQVAPDNYEQSQNSTWYLVILGDSPTEKFEDCQILSAMEYPVILTKTDSPDFMKTLPNEMDFGVTSPMDGVQGICIAEHAENSTGFYFTRGSMMSIYFEDFGYLLAYLEARFPET